mmetsp:Transcript_11954/g.24035  ORF Transcript_11954/g.24035 Transcript_11954/m.24035 type:complete len:264 (+) Transcript_11954:252-1043(+)
MYVLYLFAVDSGAPVPSSSSHSIVCIFLLPCCALPVVDTGSRFVSDGALFAGTGRALSAPDFVLTGATTITTLPNGRPASASTGPMSTSYKECPPLYAFGWTLYTCSASIRLRLSFSFSKQAPRTTLTTCFPFSPLVQPLNKYVASTSCTYVNEISSRVVQRRRVDALKIQTQNANRQRRPTSSCAFKKACNKDFEASNGILNRFEIYLYVAICMSSCTSAVSSLRMSSPLQQFTILNDSNDSLTRQNSIHSIRRYTYTPPPC